MKKQVKVLALAGIMVLGLAGIDSAQAQKKPKKGTTSPATPAAAAAAAPKKEGIKPYSEVITSKAKTTNGLFKTHKVDDKWYFEIPDSIINREMLVVTRLAKAPVGIKVGNQQYGGEELNEQVWKWERRGKQVYIRVPSYATKADSTSDMYESVQNSNLAQILASFEIKAYNKDTTGIVIDVTDFYNGDIMAIGATDQIRKAYKVITYDATRSYIDTIKTFPINIEVKTAKTYRAAESPTDNSNGAVTFEFNTSMLLLPKIPVKARIMD
ncbi:MAG: DUF5117 domain-containing protein, partial [Pedobacter sp.]